MSLRFFLLFFVAAGLLGCLGSAPESSDGNLTANASNASLDSSGVRVGQAAQCTYLSPGTRETIVVDAQHYAYLLEQNGTMSLAILFSNGTLFLRYPEPVAGCTWISLSHDDLTAIDSLGGVALLTHEELLSQLSTDFCSVVPRDPLLFQVPESACPFRDVVLRAQAGQIPG